MRPTMTALRAWRPERMADAAAEFARRIDLLDDAMDSVTRAWEVAAQTWAGGAARSAGARIGAEATAANRVAAVGLAVVDVLTTGASTLSARRDYVLRAESELNDLGAWVGDDGQIVWVNEPRPEQEFVAARVRFGLDAAGEADRQVAESLDGALRKLVDSSSLDGPHGPSRTELLARVGPIPADAAGLSALWRSLSAADRADLLVAMPELGTRAGMPVAARDFHNRERLDDLLADATAEAARLESAAADLRFGPQGVRARPELVAVERALDAVMTQVAGYAAVGAQLAAHPGAMLMDIDARGRGAIALGNPDTATHVTTLVPGTGSNLAKIGADVDRSRVMRDEAEKAAPGSTHSVIAWLGYTAPPEIPHAAHTGYAEHGAGPLRDFQSGLRASHIGEDSHNTVVGHSYGSGVIALAASGGNTLDADAVVFLGSPGALTGNVGELSLAGVPASENGSHVFATKAERDPIPLAGKLGEFANDYLDWSALAAPIAGAPGIVAAPLLDMAGNVVEDRYPGPLGTDPTDRERYGATVFTSAPGPVGPWWGYNTDVHSDYWDVVDGTPTAALQNLAHIMGDQADRIS